MWCIPSRRSRVPCKSGPFGDTAIDSSIHRRGKQAQFFLPTTAFHFLVHPLVHLLVHLLVKSWLSWRVSLLAWKTEGGRAECSQCSGTEFLHRTGTHENGSHAVHWRMGQVQGDHCWWFAKAGGDVNPFSVPVGNFVFVVFAHFFPE